MITGNIGDDVIADAGATMLWAATTATTSCRAMPAKTLCAAPAVPSNAAGAGVVRNVRPPAQSNGRPYCEVKKQCGQAN